MKMMDTVINHLAELSEAKREDCDYIQDGLLYCGHCMTQKQCRISIGSLTRIVGCQCACAARRYEAERERVRLDELRMRAKDLRVRGISDRGLLHCTFERAQETPLIQKCRNYVEHWERARRENIGLLLWGNTGGGKTYAAACIANALIDRGISAMITSFPRILAAGWSEREQFLEKIRRFQLLVLDDFGVERQSDFAFETVYAVIDERYKSKMPLILTTNLSKSDFDHPPSMDLQRVYERVLEMCTPVRVRAENFRQDAARRKFQDAGGIFGEEDA